MFTALSDSLKERPPLLRPWWQKPPQVHSVAQQFHGACCCCSLFALKLLGKRDFIALYWVFGWSDNKPSWILNLLLSGCVNDVTAGSWLHLLTTHGNNSVKINYIIFFSNRCELTNYYFHRYNTDTVTHVMNWSCCHPTRLSEEGGARQQHKWWWLAKVE